MAAFIDRGDARVLSNPQVVTQTNREAYIASGEEIIIPSGTDQVGNLAFKEKQVALELGVTPHVLSEDRVDLVIRLRNDSLDFEIDRINNSPPLRINTIESYVTLENGEAVVLGGVTTHTRNSIRTRHPFVSRIPLIGRFFRAVINDEVKRELVVVIKPTILRSMSEIPPLSAAQEEILDEGTQKLKAPNIPEPPVYEVP